MQNKGSKPREKTLQFALTKSATYVAALADGGNVIMKADEVGATIQINFVRLDPSPTIEKFRAIEDQGILRQIAPSEFDKPQIKYLECSVIMRPDQALAIAAAIVQNLQSLPPHLREIYRIPDTASVVDQKPSQ